MAELANPPIGATADQAYAWLKDRFAQCQRLEGVQRLLFWDSQTYMPPGAASCRDSQNSALEGLCYDLVTGARIEDALAAAETVRESLAPDDRANLREMRRRHGHWAAVPKDLKVAHASLGASLNAAWRQAREANDWGLFAPLLERQIDLYRQIAACKSERLGVRPYDALLDEQDPGVTMDIIDPIFADLEAALPTLLQEALELQAGWPRPRELDGDFSPARQRALCERVLRMVGHDPAHIRLDVAPHAFVLVDNPGDARVTVRFDPSFQNALRSSLHEAGHAMYELNRRSDFYEQPAGRHRGATVHESQSLSIEVQAGRSAEFLTYIAPILHEAFGGDPEAWRPANLIRQYRLIRPGFIRTNADEISYPLHVILRYRLERALLAGDLEVADVPAAWSELSQALFGWRPPDDRQGALQDFQWASGYFAYFPSYALGSALAAQLFEAASAETPQLLPSLGRGDFAPLLDWMRTRVHEVASRLPTEALIRNATGAPLSADALLRHLRRRYLETGPA